MYLGKKLILRLCYSENFVMLGSVKPAEDWPRFHFILTWLTNADKYVIFFMRNPLAFQLNIAKMKYRC